MRLVVTALLVACGASSPPPRPPLPPPRECDRVADHLLSLVSDTAKEAPTDELDRVRAGFAHHCKDEGWSREAQQCFLSLATKDEVDHCAALLTDAQREALR